MTTTLLIDADHLAFKTAIAHEVATEWEEGYWTWHCDEYAVRQSIDEQIAHLTAALEADKAVLCLSDARNFRYDVFPGYKANRASVKRPLVLKPIRAWLLTEREAWLRPGLEGDDIMGILATSSVLPGRKIIVSIDKDMKTIPGLYVRDLETGLVEITEAEADRWHMIQTLAGDPTDGYPGCPGMGLERAVKAVDERTKLVPYEHVVQRGKRKGETETRYAEVPAESLWEVVVSRYKAAGMNELCALEQARVARILRASDYDFKRKKPILWTPAR